MNHCSHENPCLLSFLEPSTKTHEENSTLCPDNLPAFLLHRHPLATPTMAGSEWRMLKAKEEENNLSICSEEMTEMPSLYKEIIHGLLEGATNYLHGAPLLHTRLNICCSHSTLQTV